jgi:hypothetical protein
MDYIYKCVCVAITIATVLLLTVFWALWNTLYEGVCCYNCCHSNTVKGFLVLQDNIYDYMCLILQIFLSFLIGNLLVITKNMNIFPYLLQISYTNNYISHSNHFPWESPHTER